MNRRTLLAAIAALPAFPLAKSFAQSSEVDDISRQRIGTLLDEARRLDTLETVIVTRDGEPLAERAYGNNSLDGSTNIKSASKCVVSALVGIAIDKGLLDGVDQKMETVLRSEFPKNPDPRLSKITIGHLLSMRAGLDRMSGPNYGRWVASRNWTRSALAADFVDEPGGGMLYSTASTHLLSVILTKVSGKPTLALARDWLRPLDGFRIGAWDRDPQGYYLGGNQMAMTPRSLHAFGELYRRGGVTEDGTRLISEDWIRESWILRTNSVFNGDGYGYAWFLKEMGGEQVNYAWGYGGQMLYITPSLGLTVAMTSNEAAPSARTGYRDELHGLMTGIIGIVRT
ncbi:6-aminohexanoate hydrolase [Rhizobium sp. Root274]|uniref:serine hydrolase domain-containing protein n=1 Tax=unclassified Rhizobium TaxID=2613769 RepID=UPI000713633D|nr:MULTISPECIES: serine hydrolase [unclassified Rhizobium]KQW27412.1 6-aminohexanoate hydrolase [Rhizobium sp. Root1240]KRD27647.1 6-aminohexanoate hydrolase [Rhizobium sp. Root274]